MIVRFLQRYLPHLVAFLALCILLGVSGLLWMERANRFPLPPVGAYSGIVSGVWSSGAEDSFNLYVERNAADPKILVSIIRPGWEPRSVAIKLGEGGADESVLPITLSGPGGRIRLRGSRVGPSEYKGIADDLVTGTRGTWNLNLISGRGPTSTEHDDDEIKLWLKLKEELIDTEAQIHQNEQRIPEIQGEIDKLTAFISDKDRLKTLADEKFQAVRDEINQAQPGLRALQEQARHLEDRLLLAQRVTPMGRLVSLSRESLEREGRWVDSMYRVGAKESSPELEESVQRGEEILKVKREIAKERAKILELREGRRP